MRKVKLAMRNPIEVMQSVIVCLKKERLAFPQRTATIATTTNDIKGELIKPNHYNTD
jgi:hypothetical protein